MSIEAVILLFALTQLFELFVLFALTVLLLLTAKLFPLTVTAAAARAGEERLRRPRRQ